MNNQKKLRIIIEVYDSDSLEVELGVQRVVDVDTLRQAYSPGGIAMALFKAHGFEPEKWPAEVRSRFWP